MYLSRFLSFSMNDKPDYFGSTNPKAMPSHLFHGAVHINYLSAVRANIDKQNYTVCPRHWYLDATFACQDCDALFTWTAEEQRTWFEAYRFYVDSRATRCATCRRNRRLLKALRQEYDRTVGDARAGGSVEEKKKVILLIDQIAELSTTVPVPFITAVEALFRTHSTGMEKTRTLLLNQIKKTESGGTADAGEP
jgi:hypothetical protein